MMTVLQTMARSPLSVAFGAAIGFVLALGGAPLEHMWRAAYDFARPIVAEWRVETARVEGDDLVLAGTMIKQRPCMFVAPPMASDEYGRNYQVVSPSTTDAVSRGARSTPQSWGPWIVQGGAGKALEFMAVYICESGRASVVELGRYEPRGG